MQIPAQRDGSERHYCGLKAAQRDQLRSFVISKAGPGAGTCRTAGQFADHLLAKYEPEIKAIMGKVKPKATKRRGCLLKTIEDLEKAHRIKIDHQLGGVIVVETPKDDLVPVS